MSVAIEALASPRNGPRAVGDRRVGSGLEQLCYVRRYVTHVDFLVLHGRTLLELIV